MASSSLSPVDLHQRIDQILNTNTDMPDFDLKLFAAQIDALYAHYHAQLGKKKQIRGRLGELPSPSEAANIVEQVSANVKQIGNEIKEYSGDKHQTSIAVLNAIGNVHWIAVGFLVVGAALKIADTIKSNKEECLRLFKSMIDLSKIILQLQGHPGSKREFHAELNDYIQLIVKGVILCCSQKKRTGCKRVFKASRDKEELIQLRRDIDDMHQMLHLQITTYILKIVQSPPPLIPVLDDDIAVGIEEKIKDVVQWLNLESNSGTIAVVIYGIGGSGKTTLGNAIYSSLKDTLQGWKHSRVTLIQSLEKDPKVEELQSLILQDLTGTKHNVRDFQSGCQILRDIIEKESIFLYVDNVLYLEPLRKLLPKVTKAKKFRLLLTARETSVSGIIESLGVESCKLYDVGSLPIDAALQVLCKQIDRKRDKDSILEERPWLRKIAEKCNCCPLFLEVIGAYLHQRKNKVESYEQVLHWLEPGDEFGGIKKYNFDESRVLFSYNELESRAKEAFLDICSFFSSWKWEWEEVACIVGDDEMLCLQEGALIKRESGKIKIHDLILLAGQNKSKDSRFRNAKDFSSALKNKELVSQVKGVWIEGMKSPLFISAEELDALSRSLRVFYLGSTARKLIILKGKCSKQFDELKYLHVESGVSNLPMNIFNLKNLRYLSINNLEEDVILSPSMNLPSLNVLKLKGSRIHGIAEIAHLRSLKQLELVGCNADGISECFPNLHDLQRLKVCDCEELEELPESLVRLRSLQKLHLSGCMNLKQLPAGFGELVNLTKLDLEFCSSLKELPCDLEKLTSLQSLNLWFCSSLACLPHGLMSVWGSQINFDECSSLSEIPEEICKQTMLTRISLSYCRKLKTLPSSFGELTCLQHLYLRGCESIQELCNDFHCLGGLKSLDLYNCKSLSCLPSGFGKLSALETLDLRDCKSLSSLRLEFGKLSSLKTLDLAGCDKLEELCSDFHCLVALKYLNLSMCNNLRNLPDHFGELGCLERLELSGCSNLVKLSDDFHLLQSLIRLNLSKCENLGAEWMDCVGNKRSLWRLHIVGSERLIQRWMEMKSEKQRNLVVATKFPDQGERALLLELVLSRVFDEEGLLVGADERPFHSSSLQPQTPLILIIDSKYDGWLFGDRGKKLQQLQRNSKALQIIYVGTHFNSLNSVSALRMLAHTPDNSQTSSFFHKLSACFGTYRGAVYRSTDRLEENGLKCTSAWEDISEGRQLDELVLLSNISRDSNFELLKELLVTEETHYLLLNGSSQVKVEALQGKIILLLVTDLRKENYTLAVVKEMYLKLQESHHYVVELVWIPIPEHHTSWEDFERAAANAPWPVVPNPWLMKGRIYSFCGRSLKMPCVCVVDEKGRIIKKDALAMIERWGVEAYPFSEAREEEVRKAEWEGFKVNSSPTSQFLLQNLELLLSKTKEMMDRGAMMFFCVGRPEKMMELAPRLNCALTMLEIDFHVFYVASAKKEYDMACEKLKENETEKCGITTPSLSEINSFWRRVEYLRKELMNGVGRDERIVKVRRMVLGLASARCNYPWGMSIVVVGGDGEMVSGRGMEMVEELCDGDEESREKLVEEIKKEGVEKSVERRWRDGIIHPKHHPQHPLIYLRIEDGINCSLCGGKYWRFNQCNVCETYVICEECKWDSSDK